MIPLCTFKITSKLIEKNILSLSYPIISQFSLIIHLLANQFVRTNVNYFTLNIPGKQLRCQCFWWSGCAFYKWVNLCLRRRFILFPLNSLSMVFIFFISKFLYLQDDATAHVSHINFSSSNVNYLLLEQDLIF